ncbi:hypothetical protein [Sporisorium scitamineum]|uniref:Heparan-alpha-glucosaminide N-acetyltransferase catalytic domain-containing protein n=1 Tax=Sporisorium scitamineum TaxID=49012 RepID=A0A0F7S4T4_9BASI|nr:hypothetical protein [Sporisorium scitamineum]
MPTAAREEAEVQDTNFTLPPTATTPRTSNYGSTQASGALSAPKPTTTSSRAVAPDLLRGLILPLMSLDHAALFMGAWLHGTPKQSESAGTVFTQWNFNAAYISRTLTHLCAPGFFFLMGMGCVYFHRCRARIGWSSKRMAGHFAVRALALTVVSEMMGESLMWARKILIINIVLIGLAVDYLLTSLLCLVVDQTERVVARRLDGWMGEVKKQGGDGETRPLLSDELEEQRSSAATTPSVRSQTLSFWLHNAVLALLTYITIFWNVWLSPTGGHCSPTSLTPSSAPTELLALTTTSAAQPSPAGSRLGPWFDFWFYPVQNRWVVSGFPPLGWISFCLMGMLYARTMLHKRWTAKAVVARNYPPSPSFMFFTMAVNFALLAVFSAIPPALATSIPRLMNYGGSALFFYV